MNAQNFLAFDLGAESGRAVLGTLEDGRLAVREVRRFPNGPVSLAGRLHWDVPRLLNEMKMSLKDCAGGAGLKSIGVDTWGVDFGLIGRKGEMLGLPYSYRDPKILGAMERYFDLVPREKLYDLTGIQFMAFNSLFQLYALVREGSPLLEAASDLLFMPDLFNFLLTGQRTTEATIASTSQFLNPRTGTWEKGLLEAMGVPSGILRKILQPGTVIGPIEKHLGKEMGLAGVPVAATAGHDTAAAVAAVPAEGSDWAYISSGTWSLVGIEVPGLIITAESRESNFTNEGGVGGQVRFLKNIAGLWLLQQCRKSWEKEREWTYGELMAAAEVAPRFGALIDPDSPDFLNPPNMPEAIVSFCRKTGQAPPETMAAHARCILESLALKCRHVLEQLARLRKRPFRTVHIIGGGSRNALLCQLTADAAGLLVVAGPAEATSAGNILVQAMAAGCVRNLEEVRRITRRSFVLDVYESRPSTAWDEAYRRFKPLIERPSEP
jgi:rhamnulokinase